MSVTWEDCKRRLEKGLWLIPTKPDKTPACAHGFKDAVSTIEEFKVLCGDQLPYGIGIDTGRSGLVVIDVDVRGKKKGAEWFDKHKHLFPETYRVETPSGGFHLYFWVPEDTTIKSGPLVPDAVDVKSTGGYVVAPPTPGYMGNDAEIAELPPGLLKLIKNKLNKGKQALKAMSDTDLKLQARMGTSFHDTMLELTGRWKRGGMAPEQMFELARSIVADCCKQRPDRNPDVTMGEVERMVVGAKSGREADELMARVGQMGADAPVGIFANGQNQLPVAPKTFKVSPGIQIIDVMAKSIPPPRWILGRIFARGWVTGIASAPNVGKTRFLVSTACALSTGRSEYLGFKVIEPGPVLLITNEEKTQDIERRIKATGLWAKQKKAGSPIHIRGSDLGLVKLAGVDGRQAVPDTAEIDAIVELLLEIEAVLVAFDPLVSLGEGLNENSVDMQACMDAFRDIANRANVAVLFNHHTPKGESSGGRPPRSRQWAGSLGAFRGHGSIAGAADLLFTLAHTQDAQQQDGARNRTDNGDQPRRPPRLPEHLRRRWIRLESAKSRESLQDVSQAYFLESQHMGEIDPLTEKEYEVGALAPRSDQEASAAASSAIYGAGAQQMERDRVANEHRALILSALPKGRTTIAQVLRILAQEEHKEVWGYGARTPEARSTLIEIFGDEKEFQNPEKGLVARLAGEASGKGKRGYVELCDA
jgi:hypothetical protein